MQHSNASSAIFPMQCLVTDNNYICRLARTVQSWAVSRHDSHERKWVKLIKTWAALNSAEHLRASMIRTEPLWATQTSNKRHWTLNNNGTTTEQQRNNNGTTTVQQRNNTDQQRNNNGTTTEQQRNNNGTTTEQQRNNNGTTTVQQWNNNGTTTEQQRNNNGTTTEQQRYNNGTTTVQQRNNNGTTTEQQRYNNGTTTEQQRNNNGTTTEQQRNNNGTTTVQQRNNTEQQRNNNGTTTEQQRNITEQHRAGVRRTNQYWAWLGVSEQIDKRNIVQEYVGDDGDIGSKMLMMLKRINIGELTQCYIILECVCMYAMINIHSLYY